ncbi:MAG: glycosyltransferase, partial [Campylobacteraceae bacterium]|nr:glycosyltransferase [Campylobacteraceae bacterium]
SLSILEEYAKKDRRIKVFTGENQGPATARNIGLKNATGEYIMFCDSDDWYELTMCEEMHNCIEKEKVDMVMCDCNVVELEFNHSRNQGDGDYVKLKLKGFHDISREPSKGISLTLWNKIFRKSSIDNYNISFPDGYLHDDDAFIRQYISISSSYFGLDKKLYNYTFRSNSIMSITLTKKDNLKTLDKLYSTIFFYNFLIKNSLLESKHSYLLNSLMGDIGFCWHMFYEKKYKYKALELANSIIKNIDSDKFHKPNKDIFIAIKNSDFQKAKKLLNKKHGTKKTLSIFGFNIFEKTKDTLCKKIYLFGFLIYTKRYR